MGKPWENQGEVEVELLVNVYITMENGKITFMEFQGGMIIAVGSTSENPGIMMDHG